MCRGQVTGGCCPGQGAPTPRWIGSVTPFCSTACSVMHSGSGSQTPPVNISHSLSESHGPTVKAREGPHEPNPMATRSRKPSGTRSSKTAGPTDEKRHLREEAQRRVFRKLDRPILDVTPCGHLVHMAGALAGPERGDPTDDVQLRIGGYVPRIVIRRRRDIEDRALARDGSRTGDPGAPRGRIGSLHVLAR